MKFKNTFANPLSYFALLSIALLSCNNKQAEPNMGVEGAIIRQIHTDYVNGWLEMDEEKVMGLFEENARIQPNKLTPIEGKADIRAFWFPNDSSETIINKYTTEIIYLKVYDTLAITTHHSLLDWTYRKDSTVFGMEQKGISTTLYLKQKDSSWKIWRSMWTDIYAESK